MINLSTLKFNKQVVEALWQTVAFITVRVLFNMVLIIYVCKAIHPAKILWKLQSIPHRATSLQRWWNMCLVVWKAILLISICRLLLAWVRLSTTFSSKMAHSPRLRPKETIRIHISLMTVSNKQYRWICTNVLPTTGNLNVKHNTQLMQQWPSFNQWLIKKQFKKRCTRIIAHGVLQLLFYTVF